MIPLESSEFTQLRISASNAVDLWQSFVLNRVNELSSNSSDFSLTRCLEGVDSICNQSLSGIDRLFEKYSNQAFVHGYNVGFEEVGGKKIIPIYIENGIWDVTKRAAEKASEQFKSSVKKLSLTAKQKIQSFGSSVRSALSKGLKKLFPRRKDLNKLSEEETKAAQALVRKVVQSELAKLDKETKQLLQDEITSSAAEGKLTAYGDAGVKQVKVRIDTVKDERRCKRCADLEGKIFPLEQAKDMIPLHVHCRCMWKFVSDKNVTKQLRREQKEQERKVVKLRERLNKNYRKKVAEKGIAVHNAFHSAHFPELNTIPIVVYNISLDSVSDESEYYLTLKSIRLKKGETGLKLSCSDSDLVDGRLVPGSILHIIGKDNKNIYLECIGNLIRENRERWGKDNQVYEYNTVPLFPESYEEYPYELVSDDSKQARIVMNNCYGGYLELNGNKSNVFVADDLIPLATIIGLQF